MARAEIFTQARLERRYDTITGAVLRSYWCNEHQLFWGSGLHKGCPLPGHRNAMQSKYCATHNRIFKQKYADYESDLRCLACANGSSEYYCAFCYAWIRSDDLSEHVICSHPEVMKRHRAFQRFGDEVPYLAHRYLHPWNRNLNLHRVDAIAAAGAPHNSMKISIAIPETSKEPPMNIDPIQNHLQELTFRRDNSDRQIWFFTNFPPEPVFSEEEPFVISVEYDSGKWVVFVGRVGRLSGGGITYWRTFDSDGGIGSERRWHDVVLNLYTGEGCTVYFANGWSTELTFPPDGGDAKMFAETRDQS